MKMKTSAMLVVGFVIVLALASTAGAVTVTWNNAAGGPWTTAGNWLPSGAPAVGDNVVLGTAISSSVLLTSAPSRSFTSLTVNNTSGFYALRGTGTFTLTDTGTSLSVGSTGFDFWDPADFGPTYGRAIHVALPTTASSSTTWNIGGPTLLGNLTGGVGGATPSSLTKIGMGVLTYGSQASTSGTSGYLGDLYINEGEFRVTGQAGNFHSLTVTPTEGTDVTLSGNNWLTFDVGAPATIYGAGSEYAIIAPGATSAAGSIAPLRLGGGPGNAGAAIAATIGNLTKYNADVSAARSGYSDQLNVGGTLDLGTGLSTTLNINPVGGSITGGYVLASASNAAGLTGTFTTVNGQPAGTTLEYSPRALWLYSNTAPRWTANANGNVSDSGNWSTGVVTGTDQSLILGDCITLATCTITLDCDTSVKDLMIWSDKRYIFNGGNTLTLTSGNMYIDSGATNTGYHDLRDVILQVGDGITPVTDAVWTFYSARPGSSSTGTDVIGVVKGIAGTVVTIDGNVPVSLVGDSSDFHGKYVLSLRNSTSGGSGSGQREVVSVSANNALGGTGSTVEMNFALGALWFRTTNTQTADIIVDDAIPGTGGNIMHLDCVTAERYVTTLNGNLMGTGTLGINGGTGNNSANYNNGRLVVNGPANTLSGDVSLRGGILAVDGDWTGAGNFTLWKGTLEGTGSIGMASGKRLYVSGPGYGYGNAAVAPGTDGTIDNLTIGTSANNVIFNSNAAVWRGAFRVDLAGETEGLSDLLAINGAMTITNGDLYLGLVDNGDLNGIYTLATYTSQTGTFLNVYFKDSPAGSYVLLGDPTAAGGVGGTHQLIYDTTSLILDGPASVIPEPATLLLVGTGILGALGIARRRRMR